MSCLRTRDCVLIVVSALFPKSSTWYLCLINTGTIHLFRKKQFTECLLCLWSCSGPATMVSKNDVGVPALERVTWGVENCFVHLLCCLMWCEFYGRETEAQSIYKHLADSLGWRPLWIKSLSQICWGPVWAADSPGRVENKGVVVVD